MLVDYGNDSDGSGDEQVSEIPPSSKIAQVKEQAAPKVIPSSSTTAPKPRRRDGPLKITLEAPKRSAEDEVALDARPAKRARLEGAGSSSLLGMLPPPKHKTPVAPKKKDETEIKPVAVSKGQPGDMLDGDPHEDLAAASSLTLLPPSRIAKGKEKAAGPPVDFFSLGGHQYILSDVSTDGWL
jgi:proline-rich protein PRCC